MVRARPKGSARVDVSLLSCLLPHCQKEPLFECKQFKGKCVLPTSSFRKGVAQGLVLKQGHKVIPKWPIVLATTTA